MKIKENKKQEKVTTGQNIKTELMPSTCFYILMAITMALPNLVYSGTSWFDTLHIIKWTVTMVPIAIISIYTGTRLALLGTEKTDFKIDLFGWSWLLMLLYVSIQTQWVTITSWSTYFKEWYFFATLIAIYIFTYTLFKDKKWHKLILLMASWNAALNVIFAELLIYNLNSPFFFIMDVPGNYIGNTGQQNMFALWIAMNVLNSTYLLIAEEETNKKTTSSKILNILNIIALVINSWGLWTSASRSGILSLFVGYAALLITLATGKERKKQIKKFSLSLIIVISILILNLTLSWMGIIPESRLMSKTTEMIEDSVSIGKRREIWASSFEIFKKEPIKGVGLGHFKWHYMEGQRAAYDHNPKMKWQFTYWAHNEYIQWIAEFGIFGGLFLLLLSSWWLYTIIKAIITKKTISLEAKWAIGMLFLLWFDAIFTRPFHRIENIVWMPFAFAIVNKELLPTSIGKIKIESDKIYKLMGLIIAALSVSALIFLGGGLMGDKYLKASTTTYDAREQSLLIIKALKIPMSKDEAQEQYAYHLLALAKVTNNRNDWIMGINQLYQSFTIRPKSKQLIELVNFADQLQSRELMSKVVIYLFPRPKEETETTTNKTQ
ncbi:MAG: O-antigen ligase family protein [Synergistaceae bacterium]